MRPRGTTVSAFGSRPRSPRARASHHTPPENDTFVGRTLLNVSCTDLRTGTSLHQRLTRSIGDDRVVGYHERGDTRSPDGPAAIGEMLVDPQGYLLVCQRELSTDVGEHPYFCSPRGNDSTTRTGARRPLVQDIEFTSGLGQPLFVRMRLEGPHLGQSTFCISTMDFDRLRFIYNAGVNKDVHVLVGAGSRQCRTI